ncbi:hypothetical protein ABZ359_42165, partial [Streptomyces sp. NPDC005968]|uniref:hypothetical protein n=1 Tax=Streptomyces sp. NPDC005968 TaxID=3154574 RepID=UPI0033D658D9
MTVDSRNLFSGEDGSNPLPGITVRNELFWHPYPVVLHIELVSRGVRLMRHDALSWVLGCHSGWFLTDSG